MVYRVYVEKKPPFAAEAKDMTEQLRTLYHLTGVEKVRVINRYDVEGISPELLETAKRTVFSEPQLDDVSEEICTDGAALVFAVEYLPGQFDQRADSAAQCIQFISGGERPLVATAKVYAVYGRLEEKDAETIQSSVINPVESRLAVMDRPETLKAVHPEPAPVKVLEGFRAMDGAALEALGAQMGLAMDGDDLKVLQDYFRQEGREPTVTEVRVVDTYWSDHCRHTTFSTHLDSVTLEDEAVQAAYGRYLAAREEVYGAEKAAARPQTLMDIATIGTKVLKKRGLLPELDESEEINACSIHVSAVVDGQQQDWLLMFKNETHNHPTEIEPFGGAAQGTDPGISWHQLRVRHPAGTAGGRRGGGGLCGAQPDGGGYFPQRGALCPRGERRADDRDPRRLFRRRRTGRKRKAYYGVFPRGGGPGAGDGAAGAAGRVDAGYLQRFSGPDQAGTGALWPDHGYGCPVPHPDLQCDRTASVQAGAHAGVLGPVTVAGGHAGG